MERNRIKPTETERNRQKQTETDRNGQKQLKWTETERGGTEEDHQEKLQAMARQRTTMTLHGHCEVVDILSRLFHILNKG